MSAGAGFDFVRTRVGPASFGCKGIDEIAARSPIRSA